MKRIIDCVALLLLAAAIKAICGHMAIERIVTILEEKSK